MKRLIYFAILIVSIFLFTACKGENKLPLGDTRTITYDLDGGTVEGTLKESYKDNEEFDLPNPTKEGYIFVGWYDGEKFVEKLNGKDYSLKAIFIEPFEYTTIEDKMIFNQEETEYFVYIYRDGCSWCSKIKNDVLKYITKIGFDNYKSSTKVYIINLTQDGNRSKMFRTYTGEDGEALDSSFYVSKATKYDEIYLASTPALLKVNANNDLVQATLLANGASKVVKEMNNGLVFGTEEPAKRSHYTITYDLNGGTTESELVTKFYSWSKITLPIPIKNNCVFVGWYEGDELVTILDNKDYNLVAKWKEFQAPTTISATEIFDQDEDVYYICFMSHDLSYFEDLENIVARFNLINNEGIVVYFVDMDDEASKKIKRSYTGEGGQGATGRFYVDGVTAYDELYIPKNNGLIEIDENRLAKYLTDGSDIIDYFENILSE